LCFPCDPSLTVREMFETSQFSRGVQWITTLIVGPVAGLLAGFAIGCVSYGIVGDIDMPVVAAFVGSRPSEQ